jgi:polysaccharide export outer membrane protein
MSRVRGRLLQIRRLTLLACSLLLACLLAGSLPGCGATGRYVWVRDLPDAEFTVHRTGEYVIETDDLIYVHVMGQESASTRARVAQNGGITMPLVGPTRARGLTPTALASQLELKLKPFIVVPSVTVTVEELHRTQVSVVGEVTRSGVYAVTLDAGVLEALALAGGLTDFANRDRIFVVRQGAERTMRIRFVYEHLTRGEPPDAQFALRAGDTIVVE